MPEEEHCLSVYKGNGPSPTVTTAPRDQEQACLGSHLSGKALQGYSLRWWWEHEDKKRLLRTQPSSSGKPLSHSGTVWLRIPPHLADTTPCDSTVWHWVPGPQTFRAPSGMQAPQASLGLLLSRLSQSLTQDRPSPGRSWLTSSCSLGGENLSSGSSFISEKEPQGFFQVTEQLTALTKM